MEMIWIWLAVVAISLVVEFLTWDLTSIWFAVSGLVALILSAFEGINWVWQLGVFIVLSALLLIFVRQICRKMLLKTDEKTNVEAFAGKRTKLLTAVGTNENYGTVKFNGIVWNALSEDNTEIPAESEVEVVKVDGNKMIVKKVSSQEIITETQKQEEIEVKENNDKNEVEAEKQETTEQTEEKQNEQVEEKGEK